MTDATLDALEKKSTKGVNQLNARTKGKGIWKDPIAYNNSVMER